MRVFSLKTCDTCRKALKALRAAGHDPEVIDVRSDGIGPGDRAAIVAAFGPGALNTRSATWRELDEETRALPPADLIAAHPTVMKRPVIEVAGTWHQGWTPAVQAAVL